MADEKVLYEVQGKIAWITLNRPESLNAVNREMVKAIVDYCHHAEEDPTVQVAIFKANGERAFSVGGDIKDRARNNAIDIEQQDSPLALRQAKHTAVPGTPAPAIAAMNKITIALLHGYTVGTGLLMALACDIRIASETASFGQPEINLGIIPGGGGTQRLTRLVGEGKAMEMILTGEIIDARTAFLIGLVNHVVPAEQLEAKTMEIANRIAEKSPIALQLAKEAVKIASRSNLDEGLRREVDLFALCFSTEDKDEGVSAFLEKRKAAFKGK